MNSVCFVCFVVLGAMAVTLTATSSADINVSTSLGDVRGIKLQSRLGDWFYAFRGIRYAKAPVGELRFKPPQPVGPWKPEVFDATTDAPACPQPLRNKSDYSEDCLRLNVYTRDFSPNAAKPVVVYLHPGGFYSFSAQSKNWAGPEPLMDRDIVLVTLNYRLGTLGFLATGTKDAPGNAGMKDQVAALRWVRDHIRNFGGDPNSITLFGYSAGSLSIGLHMISPMSKGLFHRAIVMSASPTLQKDYSTDQLELAKKQASLVGLPTEDIGAMYKGLQSTPMEKFVGTFDRMFEFGYNPVLLWMPVIEKDFGQERFLTEQPTACFQSGKFERIPLIVGITRDEFVRIPYWILKNETMTKQLNEDWDRVAPIILQYERNTPRSKEISTELRKAYLGDEPLKVNGPYEPLGKLFSDGVIGFSTHRFAHLAAKFVPVYYYRFSYKARYSFFQLDDKPYGATHHDDLLYILHMKLTPLFKKTDPENTTVERLTRMWTNFAKTGDPNNLKDEYLKGVTWKPLDLDKENFLEIGDDLVAKEGLYLERFELWEKLFPLNETNPTGSISKQ